MKKTAVCALLIIFLTTGVFAAPTDDEVTASMEGVFGVYGAVFLTTMMGQTVPGAAMDLDMQSGSSTLTLDNVDTVALFSSIGETLDGSDDMPEVPFTSISGFFKTTAESTMEMDVTLGGGPVKTLIMKVEGDDLTVMNADGKDYLYLADMLEMME